MAFIIDDIINAVGAANAAAAQEKQAREGMAFQREMWNQQRADQMPWMDAGRSSLADLLKMTQGGYDPSAMANDPGFQFRMSEGQKALERSAAARGGLNSGGALKSLARYSQGVASEEFGNRFNRLASLAGLGQNSAQHLGGLGGQHANNMGSYFGAIGNAQAAGATGVANGIAGGFRSLGNLATLGMGGGFSGLGALGGGIPTQQQIPLQGGSMVGGYGAKGWGPGTYGGGY